MKLISKEEFLEGINFRQGMPYATIRDLMSSNTQFALEMAVELQALTDKVLFLRVFGIAFGELLFPLQVISFVRQIGWLIRITVRQR